MPGQVLKASPAHPKLSATIGVTPSRFKAGTGLSDSPPTLTLTVISFADQPITIFTWPTVFNLHLSQRRRNFTCIDLTSDTYVFLELTKGPRRPGFSRSAGSSDERYFVTLEPGEPVTFHAPFSLSCRPVEGSHAIMPDHTYRFAISEGEKVWWWRYGKKADILTPVGKAAGLGDPDGPPLPLDEVNAVEFEVLDA